MHKSNTLTVHTRPRGLTRRETESERTKGNKNLFSGLLHEFLPHRNEKRLKMKIYKSQSARVKWGVLSRSYVLKGKNGLCKALVLVVCQAVLTIISLFVSHVISGSYFTPLFSRGHATLHLAVSVGRLRTFLNSERFSHYCSCPTVRDWIAVYPALFYIHS